MAKKFSLIGCMQRGRFSIRVNPTAPLHVVTRPSETGKFSRIFPLVPDLNRIYPDTATAEYNTTSKTTDLNVTFFIRVRSGYFKEEYIEKILVWQLNAKNTIVTEDQNPSPYRAIGEGRFVKLPLSKPLYATAMHTKVIANMLKRLDMARELMS
mmetsp:Transcript_15708/g.25130  ORF Transcript_15708/g.25130 Transcript_15708/m.25130 type:complete len:154 (-) Transcript_15708:846-1307(-)